MKHDETPTPATQPTDNGQSALSAGELAALLATIERGWEVAEKQKGYFPLPPAVDPAITEGHQAYAALLQHVERIEKALEFYADGDSYYIDKYFGGSAVGRDKVERAREVLSTTGKPAVGDGGQGAG